MDLEPIRKKSLKIAVRLGFEVNENLPLLDGVAITRTLDESVKRLLCLHTAAACAYGFDRDKAWVWLQQEGAVESLAPSEHRFVTQGLGDPNRFKVRIEGMWAFAWTLGLVPQIDFGKDCDSRFAVLLPNLKASEGSSSLRQRIKFRTSEEVVSAGDLVYCLHWAIRQSQLTNTKSPGRVQPYVIEERRRSLDWLLSGDQWDELSLDT
jgi:hypothetical protein